MRYEVARYNAVAIINYTSTILEKRIEDERKVLPLPWDEKVEHKPQTQEELLNAGKHIARAFGAVNTDRKVGDPPRVLARQHRNNGRNS